MNIMQAFAQRPIAFYPAFSKIAGSLAAGVLLSQLFYWYGAVKYCKFYKTDDEIMQETTLTAAELKSAKALLKTSGFIKITREGLPCKTFYDFDIEKLEQALIDFSQTSLVKSAKLDRRNSPNSFGEINQTALVKSAKHYTENTTENTHRIHTESLKHVTNANASVTDDNREAIEERTESVLVTDKELLNMGIDKDDLACWKITRKKKPITKKIINRIEKEVALAGISMADAIECCAENGWTGFKAEWYANINKAAIMRKQGVNENGRVLNAQEQLEANNRAVVEKFLSKTKLE